MRGWLDDLTEWLLEQIEKLWSALVQLFKDAIIWLLEAALELAALVVEAIPVPEFLQEVSIASMLGNAGPTVAWLVSTLRIGEAMTIIGAAYSFRLVRKVATLGRW